MKIKFGDIEMTPQEVRVWDMWCLGFREKHIARALRCTARNVETLKAAAARRNFCNVSGFLLRYMPVFARRWGRKLPPETPPTLPRAHLGCNGWYVAPTAPDGSHIVPLSGGLHSSEGNAWRAWRRAAERGTLPE